MKTFNRLCKLPLGRVVAVEINGERYERPKVSLTRDNIYFNITKLPLSSIRSIYEDGHFITINENIVMQFRSKMKLILRTRKRTTQNWVDKLIFDHNNPENALNNLQYLPLADHEKKKIEDQLLLLCK